MQIHIYDRHATDFSNHCTQKKSSNASTVHNTTLPLIITKIQTTKLAFPKTEQDTSEEINNDYYSINEITLTAKPNDIKPDAKYVDENTLKHSSKTEKTLSNCQILLQV